MQYYLWIGEFMVSVLDVVGDYHLENLRTRNSKQSVYSWRSTNVLLMEIWCIINVNLPNNGMLYCGLIDE